MRVVVDMLSTARATITRQCTETIVISASTGESRLILYESDRFVQVVRYTHGEYIHEFGGGI